MIKDAVLEMLWQRADAYLSGAELGRRLSVSRTAVWKAIEQLKTEGYRIESVPNRGYRLSSDSDVLSEEGIRRWLSEPRLQLRVYPRISSTNTVLKGLAAEGAPEGLALVAGEQTAGRGRMGRSFFSPPDSGVYMSLLLRPRLPAAEAVAVTACAAVAAAETIESLSGAPAQIKWVNDVFVGGKKVCGILSEASLDCESGMLQHLVVGLGFNTAVPAGDFPEELRGIAGAAFEGKTVPALRCRLAAGVLERLLRYAEDPSDERVFRAYRDRSLVPGRAIMILSPGREPERAQALALERDYSLRVRCADGSERLLRSGEVSIRPQA